jgi:hypothetical protein
VITIAGSQYMEEVIQGKHALMSGGAVWTNEDPSLTVNATGSGLISFLSASSALATASGGASSSGLITSLSGSKVFATAVGNTGIRMFPNSVSLTSLSGTSANIDDDPDSPDGEWLVQI